MGDRRRGYPVLCPPSATVENACDCGQQYVTPIEVGGSLVEVRKPEDHGGDAKCGGASQASFQQVLNPAAKEDFFGNRDQKESDKRCKQGRASVRNIGAKVKESEEQANRDDNRRNPKQFAKTDESILATYPQIEADLSELPNHQESVEPRIEQDQLAEDAQMRRPCRLEPPQVYRNSQQEQDRKIPPVASLFRV